MAWTLPFRGSLSHMSGGSLGWKTIQVWAFPDPALWKCGARGGAEAGIRAVLQLPGLTAAPCVPKPQSLRCGLRVDWGPLSCGCVDPCKWAPGLCVRVAWPRARDADVITELIKTSCKVSVSQPSPGDSTMILFTNIVIILKQPKNFIS